MQSFIQSPRHLIITRRPGESFTIGATLSVMVLAIRDPIVRLQILENASDSSAVNEARSRPVSCRLRDSIVVSDTVTLQVHQVRGQQARLGIRAPIDLAILRAELCTSKHIGTTQQRGL